MRKNILTGAVIFFVGFASGLILTHGPLRAEDLSNDRDILEKLHEVAISQQNILAALNSLKEDIQVIKIRVTQIQ
ncbi:MAG: hypothetical protein A3I73_01115 [Omnitrophica bacterium RIFCSPLOWO2_02_FULL_45_16]|nr:MAG: hypothetical protein A3G36_01825 [Omnitrophica bacterium RIFCSPLOWO2_12_FULL_45_13]OGX00190.1 MAG: hypothetical protein A3I73_01115 [Omnitrophica bacterium RIFCSPLOWO2_02_FULL_45_16]